MPVGTLCIQDCQDASWTLVFAAPERPFGVYPTFLEHSRGAVTRHSDGSLRYGVDPHLPVIDETCLIKEREVQWVGQSDTP
jgi:hypothetical protein